MDFAFDTETLDLRTSAVIVSVGVVPFEKLSVDSFDRLVSRGIEFQLSVPSQIQHGRTVDMGKTATWWKDRCGIDIQHIITDSHLSSDHDLIMPVMLSYEMRIFAARLGADPAQSKWYCRGSQFDAAKLEDLFYTFETQCPWHYRRPRCSRTVLDEHGYGDNTRFRRPSTMRPHNALHDAAFEAFLLQRVWNNVSLELEIPT